MQTSWNTSLTEQDRSVAEDLHDWLTSNILIVAVLESTDELPAWYSRLLSSLTLHVNGADIEAVFSSASGEPGTVDIDVVTAHRLIRAVTDTRVGIREIRVRSVSRSRITEVEATETGRLFSGSRVTWPAVPQIVVRIDGEEEPILLPAPTGSTRAPDMGALLRGLLSQRQGCSEIPRRSPCESFQECRACSTASRAPATSAGEAIATRSTVAG